MIEGRLDRRVGHHCRNQREHDDNVRVADRWVFLAEHILAFDVYDCLDVSRVRSFD